MVWPLRVFSGEAPFGAAAPIPSLFGADMVLTAVWRTPMYVKLTLMAKKPRFPVKDFQLPGGTLTERKRESVVRAALGQARGTSKAIADSAKVKRSATASGSGRVSFVIFNLDLPEKPTSYEKLRKALRPKQPKSKTGLASSKAKKAVVAPAKAVAKRASQKSRKSI